MHLSRIEIQGFKSFAKKTVFEFPERSLADAKAKSITSVVGPNGSGKSNVSDAIRWVLGEQSFKLLRCKKPDDVIFGGSEKKARQGMAEVSLYMENADRELPVEYAEVAITRRVYRDGETEYLLNGNRVRLFDILMLLARANFGQKSYSIIGQGMVDHIINISAFERKDFFDEATGVKQYQIKRDQAVNKLKRSRENLHQSNQILAELEPRLRLLSRQVKKLEKRQEVETELRELQKHYYALLSRRLGGEREIASERFAAEDALRQELDASLTHLQTQLATLARAESGQEIFNGLQKEFDRFQEEKNDLLKELAVIKGKMSLEFTRVGKQNLSWLTDKKETLARNLTEAKTDFDSLSARLTTKRAEVQAAEVALAELEDELIVARNNLSRAREDLARLKSQGRPDRTAESVLAVLNLRARRPGILGRVADVGQVEPLYETALAVAAAGRLNGVVVEDEATAVFCIEHLKQNRLSPLTFYPLNRLRPSADRSRAENLLSLTGVIALAVDLVACEEKFLPVFRQIFGNTVLVDTLTNAKNIRAGSERLVTLEGDLLEKSGVMKGGWRDKAAETWSGGRGGVVVGSIESKIKEIAVFENETAEKERAKERARATLAELSVEIQVMAAKVEDWRGGIDDLTAEILKLDEEIAENSLSPEMQDEYFRQLSAKKDEKDAALTRLESRLTEIRRKIDRFNEEEEVKKREVFRLQDEMQAVQFKLNEVNSRVNEVKITLARLETKVEDLNKEIAAELGSIDLTVVTVSPETNVDKLWLEIGKAKHNLEMIGGIDPEVVAEHEEVSGRYEVLSTQVKDLEKAITDLEGVVVELDSLIGKQFAQSFKKINKAFQKYFDKIFSGGHAKLELIQKDKTAAEVETESESLTVNGENFEAKVGPEIEDRSKLAHMGIEIMVAPPNKKIGHIAILSGGERTMTSLALICAIIETNPAPFIVMDEVDAALDEANSEKLARIIQELSYRSQFVVITHNRVVMQVADVLYGVAMGEDGVSQTLSLSLKEAAAKAEPSVTKN